MRHLLLHVQAVGRQPSSAHSYSITGKWPHDRECTQVTLTVALMTGVGLG